MLLIFLSCLLHFNPEKRLTAEQALSHPYVAKFHNPDEEPTLDCDIVPPLDDDVQLSVEEYRIKLYEVYITDMLNISAIFKFKLHVDHAFFCIFLG